jgi:hypothetical protein
MATIAPLTSVELPDWVDTPLTGAGAAPDMSIAGNVAIATDVLGTIPNLPVVGPVLNPLGAFATAYAQWEESIAKNKALRFTEAFSAFVIDWGLGTIPGLPKSWQPLVPVADALGLAPSSQVRGGPSWGIADNVNGLLRTLSATIDARLHGGGGVESQARGRARAETGDAGAVSSLLTSLWHRMRRSDT